MKDINSFTCTCFCVADPEVKDVGQSKLCTSRVGVNGIKDGEISWFSVKVWGKPGEIFGQYVKKGSQLALNGSVRIETNNDRIYPTIYVDDFKFIGGGSKKQEDDGGDNEVVESQVQEDNGGISDDDIPF